MWRPRSELITYVTDRPGHDRRYAIDVGKIKRESNWEPGYAFEQGINETIQWCLDKLQWLEHVHDGIYRNYYKKQHQTQN